MDEFESQPQDIEITPPTQGTNRRNFLKVAVVSSAAAAAAVGGAGAAAVALSGRGASPLSKLVVLDAFVSTEHACWTNTEYQDLSSYPAQADVFFWAWFTLPSHNGTSDQFTFSLVTPLPSFLAYPPGQGNANYVKVYSNMTGCQSSAPTATPIAQGASLPITFTPATSTNTVLLQVHLSANNANSQTFTMTVKITGPNSFSETGTQTITFNAH